MFDYSLKLECSNFFNLMEGKVVIVTGSTDGIGRVIALNLMKCGARVVFHGRSVDKLRVF